MSVFRENSSAVIYNAASRKHSKSLILCQDSGRRNRRRGSKSLVLCNSWAPMRISREVFTLLRAQVASREGLGTLQGSFWTAFWSISGAQEPSKNFQELPKTSKDNLSIHRPTSSFRRRNRRADLRTLIPKTGGRRSVAAGRLQ